MDPALILGGLKIFGGLFGKKTKVPTVQENMVAQADGARQAAEQYGFNPLTMLQYGQPAGAIGGGGGAPPLASTELLLGGLQDISDVASGDNARRRAANDLELELGRIKLDQLRSGVSAAPVHVNGSGMGHTATMVSQSNVRSVVPPMQLEPIVVPRETHVRENFTTDGDGVSPTIGPDIDEIISGFAINEYGKGKLRNRLAANDRMIFGIPKPFGQGFAPSPADPMPVAPKQFNKAPSDRAKRLKANTPWPFNTLNRFY